MIAESGSPHLLSVDSPARARHVARDGKGTSTAATARGSTTAAIVTTRSLRPLDRMMSTVPS